MSDLGEAISSAAGRKRGRPPKRANGHDAAADEAPAAPKPKRKYTRRKTSAPAPERAYAIFLGEDGLQLAPTGGGEPLELTIADALAIAAFVDRHRAALET